MIQNELCVKENLSRKRDETFDILKGLGIILMIWVHGNTAQISHFAYTFHMPLFLFISGYFYKYRNFKNELKLDIQRIIVPYIFTCLAMIILTFSIFDKFSFGASTRIAIFSPLWGGGVFGHIQNISESLFIGPLWFLLGLFWTRLLFNILYHFIKSDLIRGTVIFVLAILAKNIYELTGHIQLSILQTFGCTGFFYVGFLAKKYDLLSIDNIKKVFPIGISCWLFCMTFSKLSLHECCYEGFYILDILGAWGIFTLLFIAIKNVYCQSSPFWKIIQFIGRNSIIILCIHSVDHCILNWWTPIYRHLGIALGDIPVTLFRLALAISLTYLLTKNKFIYEKIFSMRRR